MTRNEILQRCALSAALLFTTAWSYAASVQTFVIAVGGESQLGPNFQCSTFGPATAAVSKFFGGASVAVPSDGLSTCKIAGGFRTTTAASGPLSDTTSVSTTFNTLPPNTVNADASANAVSGKVGASAHAAFTGPTNSMIVEGASSYGLYTETLTLSSPNVVASTPGSVRLAFTIDGSMAVTGLPGSGMADVEVNYQLGSGPNYTLVRAQINGSAGAPFVAVGTREPLTGFVLGPGTLSGMATVETFELPIDWSVPTELTFGILASAIPSSGGTASVDFLNSVKLTGITAFANGQPIADFAVETGSGAVYTAQGVQLAPVPLPAAWGLLASALGMLAARRRSAG